MSNVGRVAAQAANTLTAPLNVEEVFSTYLYTGNNSTQTITNGIDLAGEGGMTWRYARDAAAGGAIEDTERGAGYYLQSHTTNAQAYASSLTTSFNSDGSTFGTAYNNLNNLYVSWTFRKAPKFFDVVTYTGTGSAQNISHNLGCEPGAIIIKCTSNAVNWAVWHKGTSTPADDYLHLNTTGAAGTSSAYWDSTLPTDTHFTVGAVATNNVSGWTYVAYLFAHNDGDGDFGPTGDQDIIKCGSYTGTGNANGPEIDLGFEPQWVLIKNITATAGNVDWNMFDNMRGLRSWLQANQSYAEDSGAGSDYFFYDADGFTVNRDDISTSGQTYIYIAIRRGPMAVPTSATEVFAAQATRDATDGTSSTNAFTSGFPLDFIIQGARGSGVGNYAGDRLRGNNYLQTNDTAAETSWVAAFDSMDGLPFTVSLSANSSYCGWMWKRAPSFFDVVAYTGNGVAGRTVSHNLGVAPEMMWVKARSTTEGWFVYADPLGSSKTLELHRNIAAANEGNYAWNSTAPTNEVFTLGGTTGFTNTSGQNYIAYLFASLDGVSKVGSYTGNGTSQNIDCGFSSGARFVLIKRTNGTGNWLVFDTARGIVAGNDYLLRLNLTDAESSDYDQIDPLSSGFTVVRGGQAEIDVNYSGYEYIYYAIA